LILSNFTNNVNHTGQSVDVVLIQMKEKLKQLIQENLIVRVAAREPGDKNLVPSSGIPSRSTSLPDVDMPQLAKKLAANDVSVKDMGDKAILWQVSRIGVTQLLRY
jgi:hypothetical protein